MSPSTRSWRRLAAVAIPATLASAAAMVGAGSSTAEVSTAGKRIQSTKMISRSFRGGAPNGPSTHAVISNDRRYARVIAFQSTATNIVRGDRNRRSDVFFLRRKGRFGNYGGRWRRGRTRLVSRGRGGGPANGPSYAAAVDGSFTTRPSCVAFISQATNIARRDRNGVADAFVSRGPGRVPRLVSILRGGGRSKAATTRVAVSGDCTRIAFVTGGRLYVRVRGKRTRRVNVPGAENDPSFSTGRRNDMVFSGARGVYLMKGGRRPRLVARGGWDPAYNDIKRQVVTYVIRRGGSTQIAYKDLGRRVRILSRRGGRIGNGDSREPVIGNSGYYVSFESDATNLGVRPDRAARDFNRSTDVYLFTDVRDLTLIESTREGNGENIPAGGHNPSMSFYANYVLWDSPYRLRLGVGSRQIFMRWLGSV